MPECPRPTLTAILAGAAVLILCSPEAAQAQRRCRVADVAIAPTNDEVPVGETIPFVATGFDAAGGPCPTAVFVFTSSNAAIAAIGSDGIAHGVSPGTVVITARTGSGPTLKANTATLTVVAAVDNQATGTASSAIPGFNPVPGRPTGPGYAAFDRQPEGAGTPEGLLVDPVTLIMVRGETRPIDFRAVRGTGGEAASRVPIVFGVDPGGERIVAVDTFGIVTSLGDSGTATVRLTVPGLTRIAPKIVRVEVKNDPVRFDKTEFSMAPGTVDTLYVFVPSQTRSFANPSLFQFRSSDESKVRVSPLAPIVTAVAPGVARVVTQSPLYPEISATIYVHPVVDSLRLEPGDSVRIAISESTQVRAVAIGEGGSRVTDAPVFWRTSDTALIAFDSASGVVRGKRAGIATILVTVRTTGIRAITRTLRVRVIAPALMVARRRLGIGTSDRYPLDVSMVDETRRNLGPASRYLTWTTLPDSVLRVENNEIVPLRPGRARLTARTPWDSTVSLDVFVVGDIIVSAQVQGRRDLVTKWGATGQNWAPITADSAVELQAAWSPDLTRIAFTMRPPPLPNQRGNTTPGAALYIMNADNSNRVRLTPDSARIQFPAFLPSGDRIVYESSRSGPSQIWMMELRGDSAGPERQLTTLTPGAGNMQPAVSRDGQRLAFVSVREVAGRRGYGIYLAGIDGSDERLRFQAPRNVTLEQPVFSADGQTLYFLRTEERPQGKRVYRMPVNGTPADTAATPVSPAGIFVNSFTLNADGTVMALATQEQAQGNQVLLHVMLFTPATGQAQSIDAGNDERPASPTMRPPTPRPTAATPNR